MPKRELSVLVSGYTFLEGLRWHEGRLWASDFYTGKVIAVDLLGRAEVICRVLEQPSGLGWLPDGRLLISSMKDRKLLRREADGRLVPHADLSALTGGLINDLVVDAQGRPTLRHHHAGAGGPGRGGPGSGGRAVVSQWIVHHP